MKLGKYVRLGLLGSIFYSSISIGAVLDVQNGILMGATGIDVNGVLYDVTFEDGICAELYDNCDENSDFPFANPLDSDDGTLGLAANAALLDQVFIDSSLGSFDSRPELTNGCAGTDGCQVNTPLFLSQGGAGLGILWIFNRAGSNVDIATGSGAGPAAFDTRIGFPDISNYAVWSKASVVPVPAAAWLFATALIGLVGFSKRRKAAWQ